MWMTICSRKIWLRLFVMWWCVHFLVLFVRSLCVRLRRSRSEIEDWKVALRRHVFCPLACLGEERRQDDGQLKKIEIFSNGGINNDVLWSVHGRFKLLKISSSQNSRWSKSHHLVKMRCCPFIPSIQLSCLQNMHNNAKFQHLNLLDACCSILIKYLSG